MAVNAPEAGTIKEFLANEEDTVVVGQDLVRLEVGGTPSSGGEKKASPEPKQNSPKEDVAKESAAEKDVQSQKPAAPKTEESKPAPPTPEKKETTPSKQENKPSAAAKDAPATLGNREERRVTYQPFLVVDTVY